MKRRFWRHLEELVLTSEVVIDRPAGSTHPRFPDFAYPYDYGFLAGTDGGDGAGIDVWIGSLPGRELVGVLVTVDLEKRDAEVKLLLGCTGEENETIRRAHDVGAQAAARLRRPRDDRATT